MVGLEEGFLKVGREGSVLEEVIENILKHLCVINIDLGKSFEDEIYRSVVFTVNCYV